MAWDAEGTKRKILDAAVGQFAELGPDGTTVERIARSAGVNRERVYNYFGSKQDLFRRVLRDELTKVAEAVPIESFTDTDIGEYAGQLYDYHREPPELSRLLRWEGLVFDAEVPDEAQRREIYRHKTAAVADGQAQGTVATGIDPDHVVFLLMALAGWWTAVPQVARMLTGPDNEAEYARRRASVVEAARRMATPQAG